MEQFYNFQFLVSPLQSAGGGNEPGTGISPGQLPGLPPALVRLVHHLQQVSTPERHPGIRAGNGSVLQGAVVHHRPHVDLREGRGFNQHRSESNWTYWI